MRDNTLHAVAKAIAENRDLMLLQIGEIRTDFTKSIADIEVGVNASFVENYVAKSESQLSVVLTEVMTSTVKAGLESLGETLHSTVEALKLETISDIDAAVKSFNDVSADLTARISDASKANDDTLNVVSKRFEDVDTDILDLREKQVMCDATISTVKQVLETSIDATDKNLVTLADSVAKATGELEDSIKEFGEKVEAVKGHSSDLHNVLLKQLKDAREVKQWVPGIVRLGTIVRHNFGDQYVARCDTAQSPSPESQDWALIQRGLRLRGLYEDGASYFEGDIIVKDGATWLHDGDSMHLMAMRGERGTRGFKGDKGDIGPSGLSESDVKSIVANAVTDLHSLTVDIAGETAASIVKSLQAPPDDTAIPLKYFRGQWNGTADYYVGDQVIFVSATYICAIPNTNQPPQTTGGYWVPSSASMSSGQGSIVAKRVDDLNKLAHLAQWTGTLAEYDALVTKDPTVFYNITDDTGTTNMVLKSSLISALTASSTFDEFKQYLLTV